MRVKLQHSCWLFLLFIGLALQGSGRTTANPVQTGKLSSKNFEILGVTLPESTVSDVEDVLGHARSQQGRNVELSSACYTSPGSDRTGLVFEYRFESVVEFRIFAGSPHSPRRCAESALVSVRLATASGLRLGLTKDKVVKILGSPSKQQANCFTYEVSYNRPLTSKEIRRFKDANQPQPASIFVYGKVDLRFRQGKLDCIDAARGYDLEFDSR